MYTSHLGCARAEMCGMERVKERKKERKPPDDDDDDDDSNIAEICAG